LGTALQEFADNVAKLELARASYRRKLLAIAEPSNETVCDGIARIARSAFTGPDFFDP
jgi:hypothetical protein